MSVLCTESRPPPVPYYTAFSWWQWIFASSPTDAHQQQAYSTSAFVLICVGFAASLQHSIIIIHCHLCPCGFLCWCACCHIIDVPYCTHYFSPLVNFDFFAFHIHTSPPKFLFFCSSLWYNPNQSWFDPTSLPVISWTIISFISIILLRQQ